MSCFPCWKRRSGKSSDEEKEEERPSPGLPGGLEAAPHADSGEGISSVPSDNDGGQGARKFSFNDLKAATWKFSDICLLGEGGFGKVYRGFLQSGQIVAIKRLNDESKQGFEQFIVEVNMLTLCQHPNLVRLTGYCNEKAEKLLVYEYMPRGSLDVHLFDLPPGKAVLGWNARMKIALDAARGLAYLHDERVPSVIHRDMKSANILLDDDFNAKVSDFGLARFGPTGDRTHVSTRVFGTEGYCAPDYAMTGMLTTMTDVYSFGVVLLELLTGRMAYDDSRGRGRHLAGWARPLLRDRRMCPQVADPLLRGRFPEGAFHRAAVIASWCIRVEGKERPPMRDVVAGLQIVNYYSETPEPRGDVHSSPSTSRGA